MAKVCAIDGCDKPTKGRGWCGMHYDRWRHHGSPEITLRQYHDTPEECLSARTKQDGECIVWTGPINNKGYGMLSAGGRQSLAHRAAYAVVYGPIPAGLEVDHKCFNHACVNIEHLHLTTRKQNMENQSGARPWSKSGVRGVSPYRGGWKATVSHHNRNVSGIKRSTIAEAEADAIAIRNSLYTNNLMDRV